MSSAKIAFAIAAAVLAPVAVGWYADSNLARQRWERAAAFEHNANHHGVEMIRERLGFVREELVTRASAGVSDDDYAGSLSIFQLPELAGVRTILRCAPVPPEASATSGRIEQDCSFVSPSLRRWALDDSHPGEVRLSDLIRRNSRLFILMVTAERRRSGGFWMAAIDVTHLGEQVLRRVGRTPREYGFLRVGGQTVTRFPQVVPHHVDERVAEVFDSTKTAGWNRVRLSLSREEASEEQALVAWRSMTAEGQVWLLGSVVSSEALELGNHVSLWAGLLVGLTIAGVVLVSTRLHQSRQALFVAFAKERQRVREIGDRAWQNAFLSQLTDRLRIQMDDATIWRTAGRELVTALRATRGLVYMRASDETVRLVSQHVVPPASPLLSGDQLFNLERSDFRENDLASETEPELRHLYSGLDVQAFVAAPIYRGGESVGALVIHECRRSRDWSDGEQRLVQRVADRIGAAMDESALFRAEKSVAEIRSGLLNLAHALSAERSTRSVLDLATSVAPTIRRTRRSFIVVGPGQASFRLASQEGFGEDACSLGGTIAQPAFQALLSNVDRERKPLRVSYGELGESLSRLFEGPLLFVPLVYAGELMGVFVFERLDDRDRDSTDVGAFEAATAVAELTAAALKNAQLFEALQASEAKYVDLYDNAPEMYATIDAAGAIVDCNQAQCRLLSTAKTDLIGSRFAEFVAPDSLLTFVRVQRELLVSGQVRDVALTINDKSDGGLDVLLTAAVICNAAGELRGARLIMRDMSELKELELQLQHSQKHHTMGSLVSGVAHDFNNILTGIIGHASLLRTQLQEASIVSRHLETIERSAVRGAELTGRLLSSTRKGPSRRVPMDLNQIVLETLDLLERTFPKSLVLEKRLDSHMRPMIADPSQIQQVVMNLCVNARDAMPQGGVLKIVTEALLPAGGARLLVEDSGTGMTEVTLEHIFEPYYTTKGALGSGLGLSVVYGIVKAYGGDIRVRSSQTRGSRFDVTIPAEPDLGHGAPSLREHSQGKGELILLVDDDVDVLEIGQRMLESKGYRVEGVRSGEDALRRLDSLLGAVSLVMLDLVMPGIDGFETRRQIRQRYPDVPVLLVSGSRADSSAEELAQEGLSGFVAKPFTLEQLATTVSGALRRRGNSSVH